LESRAIGGAISHAEDGLYCPSRHGESILADAWPEFAENKADKRDYIMKYSLIQGGNFGDPVVTCGVGAVGLSLENFDTSDIGQQGYKVGKSYP
jgi:hypothetical protein